MSWIRVSSSLSNSVVVSPSTPLAPRRFICLQVSIRNSGVSRCASEVKRSLRSVVALAPICSSFVVILFLLLSVGDVSLAQLLDLLCLFPLCAVFPRSEYYRQIRLPQQRWLSYGWSVQSAYSISQRSRPSWISQVPWPFRFRPCRALRPRRSLQLPCLLWKLTGAFQVFDPVGLRVKE
jgi:hypothetical protein